MAIITVSSDKFPVGTAVALYPAAAAAHGSGVERAPGGQPIAPSTASGTATTTSGGNQLTLVTNPGQWANGMVVSGAGIPAGARITAGGGTATLTLSQNATASAAGVSITGTDGVVADDGSVRWTNVAADTAYVAYASVGGVHRTIRVRSDSTVGTATGIGAQGRAIGTGTTTSGSTALTSVSITSGALAIGARVTGAGIPPGTYLTAGSGASWTMSDKATASATVAIEGHRANSWRAKVMQRRAAIGTS